LETDCQKELLRKYIAEKESALNQLKNEVRIREEELINLKLVLLGDVERCGLDVLVIPVLGGTRHKDVSNSSRE
jgi:hypothetical protein